MDITNFDQLKKWISYELSGYQEGGTIQPNFVIDLINNILQLKTTDLNIKILQNNYSKSELILKFMLFLSDNNSFSNVVDFLDKLVLPTSKKMYAIGINLKIPACKIGDLECINFSQLPVNEKRLAVEMVTNYNDYFLGYIKKIGVICDNLDYNTQSYLIFKYSSITGFVLGKKDCFQYFESQLGFLLLAMRPFPPNYDLMISFSKNIQIFSAEVENKYVRLQDQIVPVWIQEYTFDESILQVYNNILMSDTDELFKKEILTSLAYIFESQAMEPYLLNLQGSVLISAYESLFIGHKKVRNIRKKLAKRISLLSNDQAVKQFFEDLYTKRSNQYHGLNRVIYPSDYNAKINFSIDEVLMLLISFSNLFFELWGIIKKNNIKSRQELNIFIGSIKVKADM